MLYTKNINQITYQDVVDFCSEGHPEGFILEYKGEFPSNEAIAKIISALANTYGGILVIGVNAPKGKPEAPFEGITFDPSMKYEEKIESIILSHIKEPIFPEVQVCDPVNSRTFIVVRVAESNLAPHRVSGNSKIYVRTGQSSTPNVEATWDKIEWLVSRRKKSEEFRELLIQEGDRYFKDACKIRDIDIEDKNHYFAILSVRIIPLYPQTPLIPFKNLDSIKENILFHGRDGDLFPYSLYGSDPIQNGIRKLHIADDNENQPVHGKEFEYIHLNTFGLYLYKRDIGYLEESQSNEPDGSLRKIIIKRLHFYRISSLLYKFLSSAILFYKELGYWGTVQISMELIQALGIHMPHPLSGQSYDLDKDELIVPSDHLKWEKNVSSFMLRDNMRDVVVELIDAAAWSLGVRYFTEEKIRKNLADNFGA